MSNGSIVEVYDITNGLNSGSGGSIIKKSTGDEIIATLEDIKGATGNFQTSDGKIVTVVNGLITNIV